MKEAVAIVQSAVKEAIAEVIAIDKEIVKNDRKTMEQFIDLGKALWKLKSQCQRGEWTKAREDTGVPQQRCSEAMRAAKLPISVVSKCSSTKDLRDRISAPAGEADEAPDREPGIESEEEPEEESPKAPAKKTHCDRCTRVSPIKDCPACELVRKGNQRSGSSKTTVSSNKVGAPKFDWKSFDMKFRPIAQTPDELVRAYPKEKGCDEYKKAQAALNEYLKAMESWKKRLAGDKK